jgi:prepilin-type N-terminal cleavage/methylation domain-containing protein
MRVRNESGVSLVELLMVVAVVGILSAIAMPVTNKYINEASADSSMVALLSTLEVTRNRAISERRQFEMTFEAPNKITVERVEINKDRTPISTSYLENGLIFHVFEETGDTPDDFGDDSEFEFDGPGPVAFTSDGTLIDQNGDVSNGTLFLAKGYDNTASARAVTFFGATGAMKTWKWAETAWVH